MEVNYDQFIGHYPNLMSPELCDTYIDWWDMLHETEVGGYVPESPTLKTETKRDKLTYIDKHDEELVFPSDMILLNRQFQHDLHHGPLWKTLNLGYQHYAKHYSLTAPIWSDAWKIHKVLPTQGYHNWHFEQCPDAPSRVMVWMFMIHPADEGGETEFLHQSKRIKLGKGDLILWPTGFTHVHRGSPPMKGYKMYITGWFNFKPK